MRDFIFNPLLQLYYLSFISSHLKPQLKECNIYIYPALHNLVNDYAPELFSHRIGMLMMPGANGLGGAMV